ncbi:bifunctional 3-(3-hydroxy-phenyl)propionate/3-hydroxycinnamic acid hydroxylase MhpA [Hyalangium versicolor]|uniref:bifunctional 3-(3-hydroxy-phenyl)propionate/3-hydroxycinnamic acid hydroxylase MhpA n=1 Tax=Hyalangium versicolor TaxID=2861190 RepID=UPI001CCE9707|nr:bifunctional 3-(3-hydroxy-phenyl)propionate/3-hydroxycinnamic acid hydroxylase [Hyalangium versicolor]
MMSSEIVDAVVVGCGPVGAITANYLGLHGLRTLIIERELQENQQPRAFSCDDETQRNFQAAGLVGELAVALFPCQSMDYIDGQKQVLGTAAFSELNFGYGHPALSFFSQPQLEGVLRQGLGRFPHVELRLGHEVESFTQDAECVTVHVKDRRTGRVSPVRTRYLLGCDGGHSDVRQRMGVDMEGISYGEPWITLACTTETPEPVFSYYVCDPERPGFATRGPLNEIRMDFLVRENERSDIIDTKEFVDKLLGQFVDPKQVKVTRAAVFTFHSKVAARWRDGRVFLLGDAAHLMPPFMGQGLCSGIRDAMNLTWKLAQVRRGAAGDALLDTYERERRPHVVNMIKATLMMGRVFLSRSKFVASLRNALLRWSYKNVAGARNFIREFKAKPKMFIPQGFIASGRYKDNAPEGQYFLQPKVGLAGGRTVPLDDVMGNRFAVLSLADVTEPVRQSAEALARELGGVPLRVLPAERAAEAGPGDVVDVEGKLAAWLSRFHADTVLLRPDRYVYGVSRGSAIEKLREQVRPFIHRSEAEPVEERPTHVSLTSNA